MNFIHPEQAAKFNDLSRMPFRLFDSVEEELRATNEYWHCRTSLERMEYLEFTRRVIFGSDAIKNFRVPSVGRRKFKE